MSKQHSPSEASDIHQQITAFLRQVDIDKLPPLIVEMFAAWVQDPNYLLADDFERNEKVTLAWSLYQFAQTISNRVL